MCLPETEQAYYLLKSFKNAAKFVDGNELRKNLNTVLQQFHYNSLREVGPLSFTELLTTALREKNIERNNRGSLRITSSGDRELSVLETYVLNPQRLAI